MSAPVRTIESGASLEACSTRMAEERLRRFPVTIGGQIVGIISDSDILAALVEHQWRGRRSLRVPAAAIVADVMRPGAGPLIPAGLPTLAPEAPTWDAAERLAKAGEGVAGGAGRAAHLPGAGGARRAGLRALLLAVLPMRLLPQPAQPPPLLPALREAHGI